MNLLMIKCLKNLPRDSTVSLHSIIKLFSFETAEMIVEISNETLFEIIQYIMVHIHTHIKRITVSLSCPDGSTWITICILFLNACLDLLDESLSAHPSVRQSIGPSVRPSADVPSVRSHAIHFIFIEKTASGLVASYFFFCSEAKAI